MPGYLRTDDRSLHRQMSDQVVVWAYIAGLSTLLLTWTFIAFTTIGSYTRHHPNYNLQDPTPASQPYNLIEEYERPRR